MQYFKNHERPWFIDKREVKKEQDDEWDPLVRELGREWDR
jgi:hypothetical protein